MGEKTSLRLSCWEEFLTEGDTRSARARARVMDPALAPLPSGTQPNWREPHKSLN